ncbi:CDP-diacylglycerol--glycerol-3-phosphate 3-phosphatidyltransferase [Parasporobacterium paucivorans]|nr:CDP-diacylglycerol--glycerol-3-phosphate 3-phosphatidyltransferase [Parasporobacterium paucivorans]
MNLPNKLTIIRVCFIPFYVFFLLSGMFGDAGKYIATILFIVASATDWLDGYLARRDNLVTDFGKFMDPLADKLLVSSGLICFASMQLLPAWIVIIIISREFIISGFRLVASTKGTVIAAGWWGKYKTVAQMIMVILLSLNLNNAAFNVLEQIFIYLSTILTIISLIDYLVKNQDILKEGSR